MARSLACLLSFLVATSLIAQNELPTDPDEPLDIEPPLLIHDVPIQKIPSATPVNSSSDPEQIQLALENARKSAASGERLFRRGIIAKVELENRGLKVVRLESDLAKAKLETARETAETQQARFDSGEISQTEFDEAKAELEAATNQAAAAADRRHQAELDEALLNLNRQKKLLALGSGRKSEVTRAEEKVAALQDDKN